MFVFIVIVNAEKCPCESQDFAKGDKDGVVDFAGRRNNEACNEQTTANENQGESRDKLDCGFMFLKIHKMGEI